MLMSTAVALKTNYLASLEFKFSEGEKRFKNMMIWNDNNLVIGRKVHLFLSILVQKGQGLDDGVITNYSRWPIHEKKMSMKEKKRLNSNWKDINWDVSDLTRIFKRVS